MTNLSSGLLAILLVLFVPAEILRAQLPSPAHPVPPRGSAFLTGPVAEKHPDDGLARPGSGFFGNRGLLDTGEPRGPLVSLPQPHRAQDQEPGPVPVFPPMAGFTRLIGGEWRQTALAGTSTFDNWSWGPGQRWVRVVTDGYAPDGRPWHEWQVYYWHPVRKQICLLGLSPVYRGVSEGTLRFDGETAEGFSDLYQSGLVPGPLGGHRRLSMRWTFLAPDHYRDELLEDAGQGLQPQNEWEHFRTPVLGTPRLPLPADVPGPSPLLRDLVPLLAHPWEPVGAASGAWTEGADDGTSPRNFRTVFTYLPWVDAIHVQVNRAEPARETELLVEAWLYHHTGSRTLRCLALSHRGGVYEGEISDPEPGALLLRMKGAEGEWSSHPELRIDFTADGMLRQRLWATTGGQSLLLLEFQQRKPGQAHGTR